MTTQGCCLCWRAAAWTVVILVRLRWVSGLGAVSHGGDLAALRQCCVALYFTWLVLNELLQWLEYARHRTRWRPRLALGPAGAWSSEACSCSP